MKIKYLFLILLISVFPTSALAYSDYIVPGGKSIGIEINSDGILIIGFYKIDGKFNKGEPNLRVGDRIIKVEGTLVNNVDELIKTIDKEMKDNKVSITYLRDNKEKTTTLELKQKDGKYKTGLYVKDSISGIGTLTYIDPETKIFGALGHEIIESNTQSRIEVKTGTIFKSMITSIDRSVRGIPGGKNAKFYSNTKYGTISKNVSSGIYGTYTDNIDESKKLKVSKPEEIELGSATIKTVLNGEEEKEYTINITKVDVNNDIKNIYFEVTDKELLEKTGGIVQGMSGSPIIQNNKIIGAVTHVVISNPQQGYGISITKMLEEGERQ